MGTSCVHFSSVTANESMFKYQTYRPSPHGRWTSHEDWLETTHTKDISRRDDFFSQSCRVLDTSSRARITDRFTVSERFGTSETHTNFLIYKPPSLSQSEDSCNKVSPGGVLYNSTQRNIANRMKYISPQSGLQGKYFPAKLSISRSNLQEKAYVKKPDTAAPPMDTVHELDEFTTICNTFWRPSLSFNAYKYGDPLVDFGSLWPDDVTLRALLVEGYQAIELRKSIIQLCLLVLRCGPLRVLQCMLELRLIGKLPVAMHAGTKAHR